MLRYCSVLMSTRSAEGSSASHSIGLSLSAAFIAAHAGQDTHGAADG